MALTSKNLENLIAFRRNHNLRSFRWKKILDSLFVSERDGNSDSPYNHPLERIIYLFVHLVAIIGMSLMILDATLLYKNSPTVTTEEIVKYPIQEIDFPAIAICNVNRISRKALIDLAEELLEFETTTYNVNLTVNELTDILRFLGHLYIFEINEEDAERIKLLHTILERGYNGYDISRIMKRLTPKCRYMLRRCSWGGKDQVCDDIFYMRRTENGYCCTFNYARRNDGFGNIQNDIFAAQGVQHSKDVGSEYGLSVLLNPQLDDYVYKILPNQGFKILVYSPFDYPDAPSGGLREVLISPRTESFLTLDAVTFYSVPEIKRYDVNERDCLFNTEQSKIFHGYYSFSDCIMHCRTQDILHLCNCLPFFYPMADNAASAKICDLKDLHCLQKYKERWWKVKPRHENFMLPFNEKLNSKLGYLTCDCFPSCEDISYSVSSSSIPLSISELSWGRTKFNLKNHSVLHVSFGKSGTVRLRQDILLYWYELMSNYGGICSLFLGVSIINIVEILYKVILRLCKPKAQTNEEKPMEITAITIQPVTPKEIQTIYWNELVGPEFQKQIDLTKLSGK